MVVGFDPGCRGEGEVVVRCVVNTGDWELRTGHSWIRNE